MALGPSCLGPSFMTAESTWVDLVFPCTLVEHRRNLIIKDVGHCCAVKMDIMLVFVLTGATVIFILFTFDKAISGFGCLHAG